MYSWVPLCAFADMWVRVIVCAHRSRSMWSISLVTSTLIHYLDA